MSACAVWIAAILASAAIQEDRRATEFEARVDALAREAVEKGGVPGLSIAVGEDGDLVLARGWGHADAGTGIPATADTMYPIGSLARQFTAVAVLQLAEEKKLSLDDDLQRWLPAFPTQGQRIALRHLLANTSGLPGSEDLAVRHGAAIDRGIGRDRLFALLGEVPFEFTPGTGFCFNNCGYLLLSMVVAEASGQEYVDYVRERIVEPLELERTRFLQDGERGAGYSQECRKLSDQREIEIPILAPEGRRSLNASARDLFRWQCALDDRLLLGEASTTLMRTSARLLDGTETGHGFATAIEETEFARVLSHSGGSEGFRVRVAHYVEPRLTVVVLANCDTAPVDRLEREIARAALGLLPAETVDIPLDPAEIEHLTGTWQIATQSVRTYEKEGSLWFEPVGQAPRALLHQGRRVFVASDDPDWRITFQGERGEPADSFEFVREGLASVGKRMGSTFRDPEES